MKKLFLITTILFTTSYFKLQSNCQLNNKKSTTDYLKYEDETSEDEFEDDVVFVDDNEMALELVTYLINLIKENEITYSAAVEILLSSSYANPNIAFITMALFESEFLKYIRFSISKMLAKRAALIEMKRIINNEITYEESRHLIIEKELEEETKDLILEELDKKYQKWSEFLEQELNQES